MHDIRPFIPQLFDSPGSLLYVGARADAHSWLDELIEAGNKVTIMEVWQPNLDGLMNDDRLGNLVQDNVRNAVTTFVGPFDYIFWWHGPEHLNAAEIEPTLEGLESLCDKLIALACPFGTYPQGAHKGNPYETHLTTLYPAYFQTLGYNTRVDGEADKPGSEIVAWKVIND